MPATGQSKQATLTWDHYQPGNSALRKGRAAVPNHACLITTVTYGREAFFCDFAVGCAAARCFEDRRVLRDTRMLAWVLMPDHAHWVIGLAATMHWAG